MGMYRLCFTRAFTARHALIGGDWGPENKMHAHDYRIEWELRGPGLDGHGYLVDLVDVERTMDALLLRYSGACLNDLPEFRDENPSLERFARVLWERVAPGLPAGVACAVRLWENDSAWAGYEDDPGAAGRTRPGSRAV